MAAAKTIENVTTKFSEKMIRETAEYARKDAEELYLGAEYDGDISDIEVRLKERKNGGYTITAKGEAVPFIEYGAGEPVGGTPYWFYNMDAGTVVRTDVKKWDDGHAHYRISGMTADERIESKAEFKTYKIGGKEMTDKELREDFDKGRAWKIIGNADKSIKSREDFLKKVKRSREDPYDMGSWEKRAYSYFKNWYSKYETNTTQKMDTSSKEEWKVKEWSGFTRGNKAQYIMDQVSQDIVEHLERKYKAK